MTINEAKSKQEKFNKMLCALGDYIPRNKKYNESRNKLLNNAKRFYEWRKKLLQVLQMEYYR